MRVATEEEDRLLGKIISLVNENHIIENEIMLAESQVKGYKEIRRQKTTKFVTTVCICLFLLIVAAGYLFHITKDPKLTIALFLGSGGLGFFVVGFLIFTIVVSVRYFAACSKSEFWMGLSQSLGIDNIDTLEVANSSSIISNKKSLREKEAELEKLYSEYFVLKEKNDKQHEEDIATGKKKPDFNFDAYSSYVDVDNDWIRLNKLKAEVVRLTHDKKSLEEDLDNMARFHDACKASIVGFFILRLLMIVCLIGLVIGLIFDRSGLSGVISFAIVVVLMIIGIVMIVNLVNLLFKFPYLSDSEFALFIAEKMGLDQTKKDFNDMKAKLDGMHIKIREDNELIQELKKKKSEEQSEDTNKWY